MAVVFYDYVHDTGDGRDWSKFADIWPPYLRSWRDNPAALVYSQVWS